MNKKIITILGCGASGIAVFIQMVNLILFKKIQDRIKIIIIDKHAVPTGGLAYETSYDCNLLNIPATGMSIVEQDKNHFYHWILHHQYEIKNMFPDIKFNEGNHFPRKLYGIYLKESFESAINTSKKIGLEVDVIVDEVTEVQRNKENYNLIFKKNASVLTDYLIFCMGGFPTQLSEEVSQTSEYYTSPYSIAKPISKIPKTANVMIVGTRLSAIDSVLMLKANAHQGKIFCVSRNGQLPRVQGAHDNIQTPTILNEKIIKKLTHSGKKYLKLNQLLGLIRCEAEIQENIILDCKKIFNLYKNQKGLLRREIELSDNKIRPWQAALFKTNNLANKIWLHLSEEDQNRVYKNYLGHFLTYRSAMPFKTALKLYDYLKNKELSVFQSKSEIIYNAKKKLYSVEVDRKVDKIESSFLINATGISSNITTSNNMLMHNLLKNKLCEQHRLGGCNVNPNTLNIANTNMYVLGAITQGVHIATSLLEHLVSCSEVISNSIINRLQLEN